MMNEAMKAKRAELKSISAGFQLLVKEGAISTVNEGLTNYYREQGHTTLKTIRQWNDAGFKVKKGSKALLLWGEPREYKAPEVQGEAEHQDTESKFYPLAYVFSNLQVEERKAS